MVLGIGEGSIDIIVAGTSFRRGETISGRVVLRLGQPKKARGLRLALIGEREVHRHDSRGRSVRHTEVVYSSPLRLGEEKEYPAGESSYDFSITVPDGVPPSGVINLSLGDLNLRIGGASGVDWRLESSLDVPMAFDINRKLPIRIT